MIASACWTAAESRLAEAITNSAKWQEITSSADATEAADWMFGDILSDPESADLYTEQELIDDYPHYCQVFSAPDLPYGLTLLETRRFWAYGTAISYFDYYLSDVANDAFEVPQGKHDWWKAAIETMLAEVLEWLDSEGGLQVFGVNVNAIGTNAKELWQRQGIWLGCSVTWEWGRGTQR
jgi:hypothetical protein